MLTGEHGGTGATTAAELLEEALDVTKVSGGQYFRALAYHFNAFAEQNPDMSTQEQYEAYLEAIRSLYHQKDIEGISEYLKEGIKEGADNDVLKKFSLAIDEASHHKGEKDTLWDVLVDLKILYEAYNLNGFVLESKLAILTSHISELTYIVQQAPQSAIPVMRVLLTVDPAVAADRISQREGTDVTAEDVKNRRKRDFGRYNFYTIGQRSVSYDQLREHADVIIDTEFMLPLEVIREVLKQYFMKISDICDETDASVNIAILTLTEAIDDVERLLHAQLKLVTTVLTSRWKW